MSSASRAQVASERFEEISGRRCSRLATGEREGARGFGGGAPTKLFRAALRGLDEAWSSSLTRTRESRCWRTRPTGRGRLGRRCDGSITTKQSSHPATARHSRRLQPQRLHDRPRRPYRHLPRRAHRPHHPTRSGHLRAPLSRLPVTDTLYHRQAWHEPHISEHDRELVEAPRGTVTSPARRRIHCHTEGFASSATSRRSSSPMGAVTRSVEPKAARSTQ
jgi:hypothetical protein